MTKEQIEKLGITFTEGMTDEDVIKLLASRNGELEADNRKSKGIIDKYSSEIASFKDKEKARMTDEEKKANELKDLQDQIATLKKEKSVSEKVAKYVKLGYTEDVAKKVAQGEIDGIDVSEYHAEFIKSHDEALKKQLMKVKLQQ